MTEPAPPPPTTSSPPTSASPPPPPWQPPRQRGPNVASILVGLVFLGIGIWYFLDTTLGLTMPDIEWGNIWRILLIVIGGLIVFRAATDRDR